MHCRCQYGASASTFVKLVKKVLNRPEFKSATSLTRFAPLSCRLVGAVRSLHGKKFLRHISEPETVCSEEELPISCVHCSVKRFSLCTSSYLRLNCNEAKGYVIVLLFYQEYAKGTETFWEVLFV